MKNKAAQELGRLGGKAKTEAKTQASRTNGAAGGRPRRWTCEHGYYSIRSLVPDGEAEKLRIGVTVLEIRNGELFSPHSEERITPEACPATRGWGDLSGDDMVEIAGGITHRRWLDDMIASAGAIAH